MAELPDEMKDIARKIHKAAKDNNVAEIKRLAEQAGNNKSDVLEWPLDGWGTTPMQVAAHYGNKDTIKTLQDLGVSLTATPAIGHSSPLRKALNSKHYDTARYLVSLGVVVGKEDVLELIESSNKQNGLVLLREWLNANPSLATEDLLKAPGVSSEEKGVIKSFRGSQEVALQLGDAGVTTASLESSQQFVVPAAEKLSIQRA